MCITTDTYKSGLTLSFTSDDVVQARVQPLAESGGNLVDTLVGHQHNDIACGVNRRRADGTVVQMTVDLIAQFLTDFAVDVRRDVIPHVLAVNLHDHPPNQPLPLGA